MTGYVDTVLANGMTRKQCLWASEHDWFVSMTLGGVIVKDYDRYGIEFHRTFTNYSKLRAWAGY